MAARVLVFAFSMQASVAPPHGSWQSLAGFLPARAPASQCAWHFVILAQPPPTALAVACWHFASAAVSDVGVYANVERPDATSRLRISSDLACVMVVLPDGVGRG